MPLNQILMLAGSGLLLLLLAGIATGKIHDKR